MFRSECLFCTAFPCGRKTWCKAYLSNLWVTSWASLHVCSLRADTSFCHRWWPVLQGLACGRGWFSVVGLRAPGALNLNSGTLLGVDTGPHCCGNLFSSTRLHINLTDAPGLVPGAVWACPRPYSLRCPCFSATFFETSVFMQEDKYIKYVASY